MPASTTALALHSRQERERPHARLGIRADAHQHQRAFRCQVVLSEPSLERGAAFERAAMIRLEREHGIELSARALVVAALFFEDRRQP
jgi:hypothetical protein